MIGDVLWDFFLGNGWQVVANNSFQNVRPWFATWRNECQVYEIFLAGSLLLCWLPRSMAIALALKATNDPNSCRTGDHQRAQKTMYPQEESNRNTQLRNKYKMFYLFASTWYECTIHNQHCVGSIVANRQAKKMLKNLETGKKLKQSNCQDGIFCHISPEQSATSDLLLMSFLGMQLWNRRHKNI